MLKRMLTLFAASSLLLPSIAWAGPNEDLAKGMSQGKSALVEQALLQGANPNQLVKFKDDDQWTPLMWAARWGNLKLVQLLLNMRANLNAKDQIMGSTALMWARSEERR